MDARSGEVSGGIYSSFRSNGAPTYYGSIDTAWHADILQAGIYFAAATLLASFILIVPGYTGKSKLFTFFRILVGVYVGTAILVCLVSDRWETGEVHVRSKYKAGTGAEVDAYIGLHIGLKGVNINLKGTPVHQLNETINYNEHFDFSNRQGLNFFGPNANQFNQEYRAAQFRGLPLPILWVAEYFTLDDEWLRWGRHYRESGLYASIALWISLVFWVLANILVFMLLRYNAYMVTLTGLTMCTSVVIKHNFQNPAPLRIPFSAEHVLHMNYGYSFWMCFFTGCFCVLWGLTIFVLDLCWPRSAAAFFSADPLQDEYLLQKEESIPSNDTSVTTVTENSLTSVDIVDEHGNASKKKRTQSSAKRTSRRKADQDGFFGVGNENPDADWTGSADHGWTNSLDDEVTPTESEDSEGETRSPSARIPHRTSRPQRGSRGLINRFQKPRRVPYASKEGRSNLKRNIRATKIGVSKA